MSHNFPQVCLTSSAGGSSSLEHLIGASAASSRPGSHYVSPIDAAFEALQIVTKLAVDSAKHWRPQHGLIFSSSAVAAAEDYFRSILTEVASLCPVCERKIRPLETRLEFVLSGSVADAVRGALDHESFSSKTNVATWSKKIASFDPLTHTSLKRALSDFDRVCHIRHAAIHAGGYVSTRNAEVLDIPPGSWIAFESPLAVHEVINVIASTIRAYNQLLFERILSSWLEEGIMQGDWTADRDRFTPLWDAFKCLGDINSSGAAGGISLRKTAYRNYQLTRSAFEARRAVNR